ncbi:T-complex protein 1 subunit gamma-like isoform X1 [Salvia miltiorrhiza]|uniref:T-complex protein 1 subunit gamma-like isoform X1 n=1 Tax=Salvia miltiorrhiza TaxID=226208 RepID=UPI0025AC9ADF|nr:T-complex protein 1 subunit gamma-like isoform X1 [Salvia miltiorrhiza]XP_057778068.1 T-complex protein 1 subunit gamma-like isoform X1 [Salvia miltiorrhiza]
MCYINYHTSEITDMKERKIWDSYTVKAQAFKTAIEAACMLLRIDDIFQGPLVDPQRFMDVEQQLQDALVEIARQKEEMRQKDEQTDARFQAQQRMFEEILARIPPGPTGPTPPTGPSS